MLVRPHDAVPERREPHAREAATPRDALRADGGALLVDVVRRRLVADQHALALPRVEECCGVGVAVATLGGAG